MNKRIKKLAVPIALVGLAVSVVVSAAQAQESGPEVWARTCGRCHRAQPPNKYDADSWRAIMGHMALNARLTSDEEDAVTEFLMGAARRLTMDDQRSDSPEPTLLASSDPTFIPLVEGMKGADIFAKQCAACHGKQGKGDGPAAVALTPRPPDLTDSAKMSKLSDEELLQIIAKGKGAMPRFDALLKPEELEAVTEFVRRLSAQVEQ